MKESVCVEKMMREDEIWQCEAFIIEKDVEYIFQEPFKECKKTEYIKADECALNKKNIWAYGKTKALYQIWKKSKASYVLINADNIMPEVSEEQLTELKQGKITMLFPRVYCQENMQENYRTLYYDFDFRLMLSVLKRYYPAYHKHAKENILDRKELLLFGGIFRKDVFDKICTWIFGVFEQCIKYIPKHFSKKQQCYLEYLLPYLFTIYVTYWKEKYPYSLSYPKILKEKEKQEKNIIFEYYDKISRKEVLEHIDSLMKERNVEQAVAFMKTVPEGREDLKDIAFVFKDYEREKRYYETTNIDKIKDWKKLLGERKKQESPGILTGKPKLLIFQWNSIGHEVNVRAFQSFGFECHTIQVPYDRNIFDEACLEQLNRHLDFHQFDLVFSLNCIGMVAEACYVHDIPYIAWCYDSPSFTGQKGYLYYPTTHVFLFDSDDAKHYEIAGVKQAHYMPLAVNMEYFDSIVCTKKEIQKYGAEISFIGSLYDTSLPEAMSYLTDYQKGYLNAVMDNQLDVYGHNFFPGILSEDFMKWLEHPQFNKILNAEFDKEKAKEDLPAAGRLQLILNKQTTNKERLLLLNLLAKHHEVKLYSYKNSEALKGMIYCGTADYYTEMPKIFRYSKINLNATLRSIQHGIPLRCLDIMACHGLLLTNYQKDFDDHFEDEKNVLFYTDAEEALEKANFYLAHESLREKIADAGYEVVKKYYDYPQKIEEILRIAALEHLIPAKRRL